MVTASQPKWGTTVSAPASWDAFEPDHLQVSLLQALQLTRQSAPGHRESLHILRCMQAAPWQSSCTS